MNGLLQDFRYALRGLRKTPSFSVVAMLTLALGIGANTAIFSVVNTVLLAPAPFPEPDRLVIFLTTEPGGSTRNASPTKFQHWLRQTNVVQDVSAFRENVVNYTGRGVLQQLHVGEVTADYFRLLGAPVLRGRTFTADEALPGGERVVVLSYGFWRTRVGADPAVVGTTMTLSGEPYTVIGIIGSDFHVEQFGQRVDVWTPFQLKPDAADHGHYFSVAGRLKPGVTLEQANAELDYSAADFRRRFPNWLSRDATFSVIGFQDAFVRDVRGTLFILAGAVVFVLLIACANVANLLLVRATSRRREIAVRVAIGAGRRRILGQLLSEGLILSVAGGALGVVFGFLGIRALLAVNTAGLPRIGQDGSLVQMDWRVLSFSVLVSLVTGILFSLAPAVQSSHVLLAETLKASGGRAGTGFRQEKSRSALVIAQVALAMILLVGSALLIRTMIALGAVNRGFDATNVLTMRMSLSGPQFEPTTGVTRLVRDARQRILALPGVEHASATCCLPLAGAYTLPLTIVGRPLGSDRVHGATDWFGVAPGYFDVFKIAVRRGRAFTEQDTAQSPPVVVISETLARQHWKDSDPLNDRLVIGRGILPQFDAETDRQIVGVVADIRDESLNADPFGTVFVPLAQVPDAFNALSVRTTPIAWVVRTRVTPYLVSTAVQQQLQEVSGLPVTDVRLMTEVVSRSISRERFNMLLMTTFALCALALAAIGLYGLLAYAVQQRTQEIGIRIALGALSADVRNMVVFQGMRLTLAGIGLGAIAAVAMSRAISGLLFGVQPHDPATFIGIPILLSFVALVAVWLPARRAARVDPLVALRYE
jgi:putative ABC transport system permease protein